MSQQHMFSIEVRVCGLVLIMPYVHTSTVEEVSTAAYDEYRSLNPRAPPKKLLAVRDAEGRILSGKLNIIKHQVGVFLDVQVEQWMDADILTTAPALDSEYRKWQSWTARQVSEMISTSLSSSSGGSRNQEPEHDDGSQMDEWLRLLDELAQSPSESVQHLCQSSYVTIRQRSPKEQHVRHAASRLVQQLQQTRHLSVATSVLHEFRRPAGAQPSLSSFHAEELLMLTTSVDLDSLILRFPEHHSALVRGFNGMYTVAYGAPEKLAPSLALSGAVGSLGGALPAEARAEVEAAAGRMRLSAEGGAPSPRLQPPSEARAAVQLAFSHGQGGLNQQASGSMSTARLLSLLQGEDPAMRRFALDKLHTLLAHAAAVATPVADAGQVSDGTSTAMKGWADRARKGAVSGASANRATSATKIESDFEKLANSPRLSSERLQALERPAAAAVDKGAAVVAFSTSTVAEVGALALALFGALKASLGPRPDASDDLPNSPISPDSPSHRAQFPHLFAPPPSWGSDAVSGGGLGGGGVVPRARRLIQDRLEHPNCDVLALQTALSCLMIITTSRQPAFNSLPTRRPRMAAVAPPPVPQQQPKSTQSSPRFGGGSNAAAGPVVPVLSFAQVTAAALQTDPAAEAQLSQWMPIVARAGAPWARLLLTLAHVADETVAEPSALLAQAVLDTAAAATAATAAAAAASSGSAGGVGGEQQYGWDALNCKLDDESLELFLRCEAQEGGLELMEPEGWGEYSVYGRNYRRGLALQWMCCRASRGPAVQAQTQQGGKGKGNPRRVRAAADPGTADEAKDLFAAIRAAPQPGFQGLLSLLRCNDWDVVMRLWAVASTAAPPSRLQRRMAMTALASLSALDALHPVLTRTRVLAKLLVFITSDNVALPDPPSAGPASARPKPKPLGSIADVTKAAAAAKAAATTSPDGLSAPNSARPANIDATPIQPRPLDLPFIRAALKTVFNLTGATPRRKQKTVYEFLDEMYLGGPEEHGGQTLAQLAQTDETILFYWTSLLLTVQMDAKEKIEFKAQLGLGPDSPRTSDQLSPRSLESLSRKEGDRPMTKDSSKVSLTAIDERLSDAGSDSGKGSARGEKN